MCYGYCCEGGEGGGGNFVCADAAGNGLTCTGNRLNVDWTTAPEGLKGDPGEPGEPGADGKSAYQEWLDVGNTGTEQDFLNSLKGEKGDPGDPGTVTVDPAGPIVDNGAGLTIECEKFTCGTGGGDVTQIIGGQSITVTPETGTGAVTVSLDCSQPLPEPCRTQLQGPPGTDGTDGAPGADGKSAYQEWLDAGNTGNEQDFLNSLKGADGADGAPGTVAGVTGDDIINPTLNPDGSLTLAADCAAIKTCVTTGSTETALDADGNLALSPPEVGVVTLASGWALNGDNILYRHAGWVHLVLRILKTGTDLPVAEQRGGITDVTIATIDDEEWRPPWDLWPAGNTQYFHATYGVQGIGAILLRSMAPTEQIVASGQGQGAGKSNWIGFTVTWPDKRYVTKYGITAAP